MSENKNENNIRQVVIVGSGCAGLTAALYTARAQLKPLVVHGDTPGGQLTTTTVVENYPGFEDGVDGVGLIQNMTKQAERFGADIKYATVNKVDTSQRPYTIHFSDDTLVKTQALIIATGARPRLLGLESEKRFWSKGVSSCATCDGFFYRKKPVGVVGGGDSAMEEATFLTRMCSKVYLIHRRDAFRASKIMTERALNNKKIEVIYDTVVTDIHGAGRSNEKEDDSEEEHVSSISLKNRKTGEESELNVSALFLAIGHIPNTDVFDFVKRDDAGYIETQDKSTYTDVDGVFACGDCVDHVYRQAVTAAGTGCMAAIDAERWLERQN